LVNRKDGQEVRNTPRKIQTQLQYKNSLDIPAPVMLIRIKILKFLVTTNLAIIWYQTLRMIALQKISTQKI